MPSNEYNRQKYEQVGLIPPKGKAEEKQLRARIKAVRAKYNEIAEVTSISAEPKRMSVPK